MKQAENWVDLAQVRDRWSALDCGNEPSGSVICEEFFDSEDVLASQKGV